MFRDAGHAVVGAGDLTINGAGGIGVVTEIDGEQGAFFKRVTVPKCPERGFEALNDVAAAFDVGFSFGFIGARGDVDDGGAEVGWGSGGENRFFALCGKGSDDEVGEESTGIDGFRGAMRGARRFCGGVDGCGRVVGKKDRHGGESHDRAVTSTPGVS